MNYKTKHKTINIPIDEYNNAVELASTSSWIIERAFVPGENTFTFQIQPNNKRLTDVIISSNTDKAFYAMGSKIK